MIVSNVRLSLKYYDFKIINSVDGGVWCYMKRYYGFIKVHFARINVLVAQV